MGFIKHSILFFYVFFTVGVHAAEPIDGPTLFLGNDETKLIKLNYDAAGVIVTNPEHLSVIVDTPRNLVVIPRAQGTTKFSVLNKDGEIMTQRRVIIGKRSTGYVKIRRACSNGGENCMPVSQYFCEEGCHQIHLSQQATQPQAANDQSTGNNTTALLNDPNAPPLVTTEQ